MVWQDLIKMTNLTESNLPRLCPPLSAVSHMCPTVEAVSVALQTTYYHLFITVNKEGRRCVTGGRLDRVSHHKTQI